ncbi:MAG: hypothetical protein R2932_23155 [Caldilineaceae bacterium]
MMPRFCGRRSCPTPTNLALTNFYATDETGKLVMHPSQALETWWECTNSMPEVAGLHAVTNRLLTLSAAQIDGAQRAWVQGFQSTIPDLPIHEVNGVPMLAPAACFADQRNVENAELYAVFPFRCHAFNRPDPALALAALDHRDPRGHFGWRQDDLFLSYLGLADATREALVSRARRQDFDSLSLAAPERAMANRSRFLAFWGPNYDWVPDQCHGGVLMTTLQSMVLQADGDQIFLLPAWPADWDVDFRLHAPGQTVVEGRVVDGKVRDLQVTPPARADDLHLVPQ